ncbi:MAG: HD domain-containing protein [Candidatus Omnitrophica bacterium]|nr:HD domain-containing protein [Candidatus Omnitrophota bacterium]
MKEKEPVRAAVIDIGSHSVKMLIAEEAKEDIRILESLRSVLGLGKDTFFEDRISQESINRTVAILEKYKRILDEYAITNPHVIATTAVREARNRDVFIDALRRKTGFYIDVLTVGDVVYYIDAYLYHRLRDRYPLHEKNLVIAELGSGSLDVSFMAYGYTLMNMGLPLGTLRLKQLMERLDGTQHENLEAVREHIENELSHLRRNIPLPIHDIILIDEAYSQYLPEILKEKKFESKFFQLSATDTRLLFERIINLGIEDFSRNYKIPPETAETFVEYSLIADTLAFLVESNGLYILEASLAEAILATELLDYEISQKYNKTNQLIGIANALCRKYNVDLKHAQAVADISDILFDNFKENLGLKKSDSLYLLLAAYLHDIGMFIHNRAHHKHTEYIISNQPLFRLTEEEIAMIACIARYHRKGTPLDTHQLYQSLSREQQITVQKLSALLRLANALDCSHKQKVKKLEVKFSRGREAIITVTVQGNFLLEKLDFRDKKNMFEEISGNKIILRIQEG